MKVVISIFCFAFLVADSTYAEIRLPSVISDDAIFQAGKPVRIWGWAELGANVKVVFARSDSNSSVSFSAACSADGKWSGELPALKEGTVGQLIVTSDKGSRKTVSDILVGEVWLGSGQSNMEYDVQGTGRVDKRNPAEIAEVACNVVIAKKEAYAARPRIRYFRVISRRSNHPEDDVVGQWVLGSSENVAGFSAVAWNFGVALQNRLHVPIGLIVSSVGNTPVETWMSRSALEATSVGAGVYERSKAELAEATPERIARYTADLNAWRAANPSVELQRQNLQSRPMPPSNLSASNYIPNQYYNGMIHGLEPYSICGVIWFQANGNWAHPFEYSEMFQALIKEWRQEWKERELPFYFVEEANFHEKQTKPVEPNNYSLIREQQHGALALPAVGMICSIDLGNGNGHFPNKKPVGERLAGLALRDCYGEGGQVNSPIYMSFNVEGNRIRLKFTDAQGLRVRGGGALKGFAICGAGGEWVWATGQIDGQDIVVWSDRVPKPVAVRYAWAVNPVVSVENGAGLPLCPFRTDTGSKE
jgi:sialate O-acetylesterase